jgi:heptosyltransferase-2
MVSLVVQTSFLGDTVLTTPLLTALAEHGPVDVIVRPDAAAILDGHPAVRDLLVFAKRGQDRGWGGIRRLAAQVRQRANGAPRQSTHAFLAQGSWRSALLPWLAGVPTRIGWTTSSARWLYTQCVPHDATVHAATRLWQLGAIATPAPRATAERPSLALRWQDVEAARALIPADDGRPLVVLAPGSVWATKRWPGYPALAAELAGRARVVIAGSSTDRPLAQEIRAHRPDAVDATGQLSILGTAALIRHADALVANDSLAIHLASAVNTPTVAVFGPTVPRFGFGPLADGSVVAEVTSLPCRPCHAHGPPRCPQRHFRCMRELSPSQVLAALNGIWSRADSPRGLMRDSSRP